MALTWKRVLKDEILKFVEENKKLTFTRKEIMNSKLEEVFNKVDSNAEEKETIFRNRLRQIEEEGYVEKIDSNKYKFNYGWIPLYKEIAHKVLEYENKQDKLIEIIKEMKSKDINTIKLEDENENGEKIPIEVMDPFTFFNNFNRSMKIENRLAILNFLKDKWNLKSELPDDIKGVPTVMPLMAWTFRYKKDRGKNDIRTLWEFFKHLLQIENTNSLDRQLFNNMLNVKGIGTSFITQHMFNIRPELFLPFDNQTKPYIKYKINDNLNIYDSFTYESYLKFIEIVRKEFSNYLLAEISHKAFISEGKEHNNVKYFWLNRSKENYEKLIKNKKSDVRTHTEEGNKRQVYSDFEKASLNDNVYIYEVSGEKKLKAIAKVVKGIHENNDGNEVITVELEKELENPLSLKLINEETDIDHMGKVFHELTSVEVEKIKELIKNKSVNYYWLNRGKETSKKLLKNGELIVKTTWEDGSIMQNYEDYQNCKKEDVVFCYEVSPAMKLFAITKVVEELHTNENEEVVLKIELVEKLDNPISMDDIKKRTGITQRNGVIHKLKKNEASKLKELIKRKNINYWIFNSNPKKWDIIQALEDDNLYTWGANQHKQEITKGDKFVIYVAGEKRGIYATGKVVSNIKTGKENEVEFKYSKSDINEERDYVEVEVLNKFLDNPISYKEILDNKILKDANFGHQGTNLEMSEREFYEILKLKGIKGENMKNKFHKNTIFYGPPGTGKTYNVVGRALKIINGEVSEDREEAIREFEDLSESGQIEFITFHQSYSYEEFIEGLKPITDDSGDIKYEIRDGVFKKIASNAKRSSRNFKFTENLEDYSFYKLSLGRKEEQSEIFDYCINNNVVALGWGEDIDFADCETKEEIATKIKQNNIREIATNFIHKFKNLLNKGDIVFISHGNLKLKAIGKITGDYFHDNNTSIRYSQFREVEWLYVLDDNFIDVSDILINKQFSRQTIYPISKEDINFKYLKNLTKENKNYVLIIDEINRGNISKVFGELITLIEEDKRLGEENEMKITLPYSKEEFGVPQNLYLIGTMNTADRSIALMDTALRRRFSFEEMMPEENHLDDLDIRGINVKKMLKTINDRIEFLYDRDHTIGHSYFLTLKNEKDKFRKLCEIFSNKLIPLLQEYFYDDWENIQIVLGDHKDQMGETVDTANSFSDEINEYRFVQSKEFDEINILGFDHENYENINTYRINSDLINAEVSPKAFIKIYDKNEREKIGKNEE
ncbi:MAG: EVE domain-containing protein [Candidatus Mcinerneyibacterium aminivorans]|uniref:EVE domain-containing protein n=1 Tax=Candidatus Mcinerneyibacterium aminivorans TaxID=2703815 RepID=A0A5D0ML51_9BACT|nr:MAG: EVE domain-containing protein [Candidatus Mcinerneyibacterium aminivorans]